MSLVLAGSVRTVVEGSFRFRVVGVAGAGPSTVGVKLVFVVMRVAGVATRSVIAVGGALVWVVEVAVRGVCTWLLEDELLVRGVKLRLLMSEQTERPPPRPRGRSSN